MRDGFGRFRFALVRSFTGAGADQIAPTGRIGGTAPVHDLSVQGHVSGTVEAPSSATSMVRADVTNERITVEAGARIEDRLKRLS